MGALAPKRKKLNWSKGKSGPPFKGAYERDRAGERVFVLTGGRGRRITFESWQAAALAGWARWEA